MKPIYTFAPITDNQFPLQHHLLMRLVGDVTLHDLDKITNICNIHSHPNEFDEGSVFIFSKDNTHYFNDTPDWNRIVRCKNKKVLINHCGCSIGFEPLHSKNGAHLVEFIKKIQVENQNVFFILPSTPDKAFIESVVPGCHTMAYDEWAHEYRIYILDNPQIDSTALDISKKRFGLFVRRYSKERLNFFLSLHRVDLLKKFHYTFSNWENPQIFVSQKRIATDIDPKLLTKFSKQWAKGMPYSHAMTEDTSGAYPNVIESYIKKSQLIIVQETSAQFMSAATITEKTYKAIYNKKPFFILGHCKILEYLKADGFLTFDPFINESYDHMTSYSDRVAGIINEIERFANMSDVEFQNFLNSVRHITMHNYKRFLEKINESTPANFLLENLTKP